MYWDKPLSASYFAHDDGRGGGESATKVTRVVSAWTAISLSEDVNDAVYKRLSQVDAQEHIRRKPRPRSNVYNALAAIPARSNDVFA